MSPNTDRFRVLRRLPEIKFEDELRGYSKSQVDRVLESLAPLADDVDELMSRLAEAETRAASAEARLVERSPGALAQSVDAADPAATMIEQPAAEVVAEPVVESPPEPQPAAEIPQPSVDYDETLRNTLVLAQRTADTAVREANDEAARIRTEAADEAEQAKAAAHEETEAIRGENERIRTELAEATEAERTQLAEDLRTETETRRAELEAELETAHGAERAALITQIDELQRTRDILNGDIETLAIHLDARRTAIRRAVEELTLALDDPDRLTDVEVPGLVSGEDLDPDSFEPIALNVDLPDVPGTQDADNAEGDSGTAESSGLLLGEADAGSVEPAPEAVGDSTQPIDVLAFDDDDDHDDDDDVDDDAAASSSGLATTQVAGPDDAVEAESAVTDPWVEPQATTPADAMGAADRPAWADSVPTDDELAPVQGGGPDPFLDELRRVTDAEGEQDADDEALSRFLSEDNDDDGGKSGWFGRKR